MIEDRFKEAIDRYYQHGIPTGSFLEAVLENNLKEAIGRADSDAIENLKDIVIYLYNDIPSICWGSPEKVKNWFVKKHSETSKSDL